MTAGPERPEDIQDEDLIAEVAAGNRQAFEVLMRRHLRRSIALAERVVGDPQEAEDIVQDAFFQLWNHADQWRPGEGRFTTWLYRIVLNRAIDVRRRRRPQVAADVLDEHPATEPDAESVIASQQIARQAEAAVTALPERQRTALALCFQDGLTCQEAAAAMNVTVSAMESLLVRARRAVKVSLWPLIRPHEGGEP